MLTHFKTAIALSIAIPEVLITLHEKMQLSKRQGQEMTSILLLYPCPDLLETCQSTKSLSCLTNERDVKMLE